MILPLFKTTFLHPLPSDATPTPPPARFTYPFHYAPHELAKQAAADLQRHLLTQTDWDYNFGLTPEDEPEGQGKMFGVLVVQNQAGELHYLAAYSGKLAESNHLPGFVPPVYDILDAEGFYKAGEKEVNALTERIETLEAAPVLQQAKADLQLAEEQSVREIAAEKLARKQAKVERDLRRQSASHLPPDALKELEEQLAQESVTRSFALKDLTRAWKEKVARLREELRRLQDMITQLKLERKNMSNDLQARIFQQYRFLDANGAVRDLLDIFGETVFKIPPAGAGECAAPKLLQYAYLHGLQPIVMAEFWWGKSPKSAVRKHGRYYPACRGKCLPILTHMLVGLDVDPNPMAENPAAGKDLPVVYEDDDLLIVNKPAGFLSVPGKLIEDSVQSRMEQRFPEARNHLIVHRLDMSTSGLLLLTKKKEIHLKLQQQFFKRSIKKRYVALLESVPAQTEGFIDLPLAGDFEDRPRQIVDFENGKTSRTRFAVTEVLHDGRARVNLWPLTGRTHQLRVHCAHYKGLNAAIVGDELYGVIGGRLCLHAEELSFVHPGTGEEMTFLEPAEF
ncbi:RNA pseudouridine synthase [Lewinella sp. 4G2]|nr:RNA pseudouridine synthase [Lewinella sp. 4G2]